MPEVIAQITQSTPTGGQTTYRVIAVTETSLVAQVPVTSQHHYWILPTADLNDPTTYLPPQDDPTYNMRQDWIAYREQFNLLQPEEIKAARKALGLTLREVALILGMSFSTLSNIENNRLLQSFDHEVKLRYLTKPTWLRTLVRQHRALIVARAAQRKIDAERLLQKLRRTH